MRSSWILLLLIFGEALTFPFIALVPLSGLMVAWLAKDQLECLLGECCSGTVYFNQSGLNYSLTHMLHGQHIAAERIYHHLSAHMLDRNPHKALALSFHGHTGVGKNFVADLISKSIFKTGTRSKFRHTFDATIHFVHRSKIDFYKENLHRELSNAVRACPYSLFVFDEMHNMPSGILDVLAPLLDMRETVDGVDFRRSIFLFLSNAGGNAINRIAYDHLQTGKPRNELQYSQVNRILTQSAFTEQGGLQYSDLIRKQLITATIPFLPLQIEHVRLCVKDLTDQRQLPFTEDLVNFVLDELDWSPDGTQLFSVSGCKRVYEKVAFYVQQM